MFHLRSTLQEYSIILSLRRRISRKGGFLRGVYYGNIKSDGFAFPGVYSPVEAGEVARVAWLRGGDLPRGLRKFAQDGSKFAQDGRLKRCHSVNTFVK